MTAPVRGHYPDRDPHLFFELVRDRLNTQLSMLSGLRKDRTASQSRKCSSRHPRCGARGLRPTGCSRRRSTLGRARRLPLRRLSRLPGVSGAPLGRGTEAPAGLGRRLEHEARRPSDVGRGGHFVGSLRAQPRSARCQGQCPKNGLCSRSYSDSAGRSRSGSGGGGGVGGGGGGQSFVRPS